MPRASTGFLHAFADELAKLAVAPPNLSPASPASANAIPVQRIPSGPAPAPGQSSRPATPTAPAYQPPQATPAAAPKKTGGSGSKAVGSSWLQMADRRPTESTSTFVNRQYGVPERQMGVNKDTPVADANDPKTPQMMRTPWASTPFNEAYAPAIHTPQAKDTSKMNVPQYLQRAVGGINNQPRPYTMQDGRPQATGLPQPPKPTTATTTQQPAQAAI